jgi:hypothetical protein
VRADDWFGIAGERHEDPEGDWIGWIASLVRCCDACLHVALGENGELRMTGYSRAAIQCCKQLAG